VKVGTAGGSNSHQLVYRCMQGLFREVGLSPNFIWDGTYEVPDKYLTYEHRQALEQARLEGKVKGIQAIHRGISPDMELKASYTFAAAARGSVYYRRF
jgi:hypothetical protein